MRFVGKRRVAVGWCTDRIPMTTYDPELDQQRGDWSAAGEDERITAVEAYHRNHDIHLPQLRLHAALHTVVENQLALGEQVVIDALARLRSEGLTRHDAVHAIAMVVSEHMFDLIKAQTSGGPEPTQSYLDRVRQLTADRWRESGDPGA
jgi:hypothetical protein